MRFPFLIACILAFACISVAATDACTSWENFPAEISKPKTSKFALLLKPFQGNAKDLPWTIATYPAYANQTEDGWNVHIHGNLHNRQPFSKKELNELALESMVRVRLVESKWKFWQRNYHTLTKTELEHARPLMHEIASVPIKDGVIGVFFPACEQSFVLPTRTNVEGSFYGAITVPDECVPSTASNETTTTIPTTRMILAPCNVRTPRDDDVNNAADVFFVPPKGVTIIADIDDTLRVMDVWNVKQTLLNAFARPLTPWRDMPEVLNDLKGRIEAEGQNIHFHYLTDAPEMVASTYTPALTELYPPGSFDFRPVNFTNIDAQGDDDLEAEDDDEGDDQGEDGQDEDDQDEDDQEEDDQEEDDQDEGGLDHHGQNRTVQDVHDQDVDEQDAAEQDVGHQNIVMQDPEHRVHVLAGEDVPHHGHIIHADDQDDDHDRGHDEE
ncbi:unnamed protein product [Aureobasidium pullulans]|nr:unnamed protein product [Aureobasidium pullulans]